MTDSFDTESRCVGLMHDRNICPTVRLARSDAPLRPICGCALAQIIGLDA